MDLHRRAIVGLGGTEGGVAGGGLGPPAELTAALSVEGDGSARFATAIEDVRAYAARHMAVYGLPGLTLSVVAPGGTTALMRFGYAEVESRAPLRDDHLFQVGSISKSFTALCIFQLMEAGRLSLDADVGDLLPGAPLPAKGRITVQNLLNHSSGLPDDAPLFPRGGDGRLWQGFEPGTRWSYSNLGFMMLGMIVERLDRRPLAQCIHARVLQPLGMTATRGAILTQDRALYAHGYSPLYPDRAYPRAGPLGPGPWTEMTAGSGCVASTARDMARYGRYLLAAGQGKGAPLLSDAGAARFTRASIEAPDWSAVPGSKYANGMAVVEVGGRMLLHHTGGMLSFNSSIHLDPQAGVGAFASTNVGLAPYRPRDITAYACTRLRAVVEGAVAPRPAPAPPVSGDTGPYLGRYGARDGAVLTVAAAEGGLSAQFGAEPAILMEAIGQDAFSAVDPKRTPFALVFRRDAKPVTRAWHGGREFVRLDAGAPVAPFSPPTAAALAAVTGHYVSTDSWAASFRITAQGDTLFVDDVTPLVPLADGGFRVGKKDWSPERMRFDAVLDGRPTRATLSGVDHVRRTD
jgi:D-alanyl-D-alanine carboxypeptidase